jgi:hypothetical protein
MNEPIQYTIQRRHDNSKYKVKVCGTVVPIKRLFLPLLATSGVFAVPEARNYFYLPLVTFLMSVIIYTNFPILILFTNSRPLYYEDLFIDFAKLPLMKIDSQIKARYIFIFEVCIIVTNSLFTAAMSEYWFYQISADQSYAEIVGITGGILKVFQLINHLNGCLILFVIKQMIQREEEVEMQTISEKVSI